MAEEIKIDEKLEDADLTTLEFIYNNAVNLINKKQESSYQQTLKVTVLFTGSILMIVSIIPIFIDAIGETIIVIGSSTYFEIIIYILFLLLFGFSIFFIINALLTFLTILKTSKGLIFPYIPLDLFFKNELYKYKVKKIKIKIIELLNKIIHENHERMNQKARDFNKGMNTFRKGIICTIISLIAFSVIKKLFG